MRTAKILFIIGSIMVGAGMIGIIIRNATKKEHYLVTDESGHRYITNYIHYESNCIVFYEPENDIEHKLCNEYKIEKI
jgi:hypothetical protein